MDGSFPPSPVEDRVSKRLSVGSLLHKLAELKGTHPMGTAEPCRRTQSVSVVNLSLSESESSIFFDPLEESLSEEIVATIAHSLSDASLAAAGSSKLILPDRLLASIGQELVHLAACEPCGLRGALIDLCVDTGGQGEVCSMDQIAVDASLVPTFHVTLVLRTETGGFWPKVQKLFKANKTPQSANAQRHQTLRLSCSFRAIKRKLYCSGDLLVEECC